MLCFLDLKREYFTLFIESQLSALSLRRMGKLMKTLSGLLRVLQILVVFASFKFHIMNAVAISVVCLTVCLSLHTSLHPLTFFFGRGGSGHSKILRVLSHSSLVNNQNLFWIQFVTAVACWTHSKLILKVFHPCVVLTSGMLILKSSQKQETEIQTLH